MEQEKSPETTNPVSSAQEPPVQAPVAPSAGEEPPAKARKKEGKASVAKIAALEQELEQLKKELAAGQDTYQRMLAEYANYKRRTEQEKEQVGLFTRADLLKQLLPTVDNLDRAAEAPAGEEYKKGVDMTIRQFHEALATLGLEEIPADGQPFDPEIHHAVMREDADGVEPDTVTEVFQKGYRVSGRVLRPAMVKVAN
ncbi:MAG: nucleotide exchange factor GrpE [Clostridiales bacterium]|nr:nucleotide exchange factor GrpE [Clostridiales bacterium]